MGHSKRKQASSNHSFSGATLVSGRVSFFFSWLRWYQLRRSTTEGSSRSHSAEWSDVRPGNGGDQETQGDLLPKWEYKTVCRCQLLSCLIAKWEALYMPRFYIEVDTLYTPLVNLYNSIYHEPPKPMGKTKVLPT